MQLTRQRKTRRPLVLWLDDNMPLLVDQVGHLNLRGYDVEPTPSVTGFLRALDQSVNIAIIDIKLGEIEDGRALIDLVYANRPEIGIVVHSSYPDAFLSSRYDAERVRFVKKDPDDAPVEAGDTWPLAETLASLVITLNKRQAGLRPYPVAIISGESERRNLTWETVERLRAFATEHFVLALAIGILFIKVVLVAHFPGIALGSIVEYFGQVAGFALPFLLFIILAWAFTPKPVHECSSPHKFVQLFLEQASADPEFRAGLNRVISLSGSTIPEDDFSALALYYELQTTRHLWLARVIIGIFALASLYLVYDIARDIIGLWGGGNGQ
jgi:hypothetical protein